MPAGKLQLYHHIIPSEKELGGQTGTHEDYWLPAPEPTQPSVPTVPTVTQVSLGEGRGLATPHLLTLGLGSFLYD